MFRVGVVDADVQGHGGEDYEDYFDYCCSYDCVGVVFSVGVCDGDGWRSLGGGGTRNNVLVNGVVNG